LVAREGWLIEREEHRATTSDTVLACQLVAREGWLIEREEHRATTSDTVLAAKADTDESVVNLQCLDAIDG
jgi:hypothetical protein